MEEGTYTAGVVAEEEEVWKEGLAKKRGGQDRRRCRYGADPAVPRKADAEPGVVGSHRRMRVELLREGTDEAGVAAEEEEVREEGEGHTRPEKDQNRRRRWYRVIWMGAFFPSHAHRRAEGG